MSAADNETYDNTYIEFINSQNNNIFSSDSNVIKYESFLFKFNILLQELYITLLSIEIKKYEINQLNEFINNFLVEYDLDPKNVFEIMTSNPQDIFSYSSLIGFFYQHGIGCKVDKIKAFEIFSNTVKNNQKIASRQFSEIALCNDEIKKLNEMVSQYFYSFFLYEDIILNRKDNYKLNIKNAEKGDPISQFFIGNCYLYGKRITRDYIKAFEWYLRSSEGGNIEATYRLGCCYCYGDDVMKDRTKAFELYLKSAEGGYKRALHIVGDCYRDGDGVLKDENKAFEWHLKAAKMGYGYSQYLVAEYYNNGEYIPQNEEKGFYWNRKAAINNVISAQYELAEYYLSNSINKNEKKAFDWYLKLANVSLLRAIYLIAKCYRDGIGTDKNLEEATKWIKKYISSKSIFKVLITLNDFLKGSEIDAYEIPIFEVLIY